MSDTVKMTEAARRRLKENAEYHAAKNDAATLEAKIARMRGQLRSAEIVEAVEGDAIGMGSTVTYADSESGKEMTFTLVPATEADPGDGRLSMDSPVGESIDRRPSPGSASVAGTSVNVISLPLSESA